MLFNSLEFALFLPTVFVLYWFVFKNNLRNQNILLLISSYVFYGWWDWRFLTLILLSSLVDYFLALNIRNSKTKKTRKTFLIMSLLVNLGVLGFFKYFQFFTESFIELFQLLGFNPDFVTLNIILPVGISFYTFQTLSYTIDVYRGNMEPTKDLISFLAFVSFFPQLVAGPIERAKDLLPQFYQHRPFSESLAKSGMRQILWGLFKKIVIADNCSTYANYIFQNYQEVNPSLLVFGAFYFAFQIYCDFSGYSDIAIGTARLFGFNLSRNFAYPYFSRDVGEFWRRWHISLSTWFRDYVYIPLGGNRSSKLKTITNTLIVFGVSGLWHGANWTFVVWGILNGLYLLPLMLINIHKKNTGIVAENSLLPSFKEFIQISLTFVLTLIAWVFFRSENLSSAFSYLSLMFDVSNYSIPRNIGMGTMFPLILILVISEWFQRKRNFALEIENLPVLLRWTIYITLTGLIAYHSSEQDLSFIYFQF